MATKKNHMETQAKCKENTIRKDSLHENKLSYFKLVINYLSFQD